MMNIFIVIVLVLSSFNVFGQADSTFVLNYQDFIKIVIQEHPFAKQAEIKIYEGEANLLYAKGAFDPKIYTEINQKSFKGNEYYNQINGGLKIPTWFGVELKGGYEQNRGVYLNPENTTPSSGLLYAGVSFPIGQGLFIDKRRAELKKAKLFNQVSELERQIILNELIFRASVTYWEWFKNYNSLEVYKDAYRLATERHQAIILSAKIGDKPAIDALEAGIQAQSRLLGLQQAELEYKNSSMLLSIYIWEDGIIPLELAKGTIPVSISKVTALNPDISYAEIDSLVNIHPALNQSRLVIDQFKIDKRLKKNQLLPTLNLKYNPITEYVGGESLSNFSFDNYTWGLEFQMPIFLRKERGSLKLTELKIEEYKLQLSNKQELLKYKVTSEWNKWNTTIKQIDLYTRTVDDTRTLLEGEQRLFEFGESSLFKLNAREVKYIQTQLKYIELLTKNRNAALKIKYIIGTLQNQ
ncbi:TolC family protein [Lutibacter sp.]